MPGLSSLQIELGNVKRERDELKAERDTWAIAAEVLADYWEVTGFQKLFGLDKTENDVEREWQRIAAAYALAEAHGVNWREGLSDEGGGMMENGCTQLCDCCGYQCRREQGCWSCARDAEVIWSADGCNMLMCNQGIGAAKLKAIFRQACDMAAAELRNGK